MIAAGINLTISGNTFTGNQATPLLNIFQEISSDFYIITNNVFRGLNGSSVALSITPTQTNLVITTLVAQQEAATRAQAGAAPSATALTVGARVFVLSLGCEAELIRAPDDRGRAEVRAGLLTIKVDVADLRLSTAKRGKTAEPPSKQLPSQGKIAVSFATATPQGAHNTLDVRGMRADEAIAATERFLDAQLERESDVAYIIHGHGTGALKKELRRWLETSSYVQATQPGERHQGGDGVTAVLLS
jgi:DNA mismatch repair protein MutS2